MVYAADFETTTVINDCRVWAYGTCAIDDTYYFQYGNNLDDFMAFVERECPVTFYFHNLKFDGEFIISWLFAHGYTHTTEREQMPEKSFSTLISDKGMFYTMSIMFERNGTHVKKAVFLDSLKILPFSVDVIAKGFQLPILKGSIDYDTPRPAGHQLTEEEVSYLKNDCEIVARALLTMFDQGLTAMTSGSNALRNFKEDFDYWKFKKLFPTPEYDKDIRESYKGGFTYLMPQYADKDVADGIVLDVNSLYPSVMYNKPLPYGYGKHYKGRYKPDLAYPQYVQMFSCQFELKPGYIPTIQLKNNLAFIPTDYVSTSGAVDVPLCLTSVDLALFFEHYDVYNINWISGWKFKSTTGLFKTYIDRWSKVKIEAKQNNNKAMYTLSKLMLNALYGKFAMNPHVRSKYPVDDHGIVKYLLDVPETREALYIPIGTFITSWARDTTIRAAQSLYHRFIYADTDSLHLLGSELPEQLAVDPVLLGAWKHESCFDHARFIRQKTYIEHVREPETTEYEYKITCAGMPSACYEYVTWDNFHPGARYQGKLRPRHTPGGIVLEDVDFTLLK